MRLCPGAGGSWVWLHGDGPLRPSEEVKQTSENTESESIAHGIARRPKSLFREALNRGKYNVGVTVKVRLSFQTERHDQKRNIPIQKCNGWKPKGWIRNPPKLGRPNILPHQPTSFLLRPCNNELTGRRINKKEKNT
jgi:hypothetical protein